MNVLTPIDLSAYRFGEPALSRVVAGRPEGRPITGLVQTKIQDRVDELDLSFI